MKGDAIGDTLYSERFVLTTLMKLPKLEKPLSEDEDYEKELCTLWDQSVEKDVVKFLLEYNVLDIFASCLNEDDVRLTEILVGIVANMCAEKEARETLERSPEVTIAFLSLITCSDSLILIQLMRFFQSALVFENAGDELIWFQYFAAIDGFVEKFAFVLASSMSNTLLKHALEALNAIFAKFTVIEIRPEGGKSNFVDMFVIAPLIDGLIEAFNQVIGNNSAEATSTPTDDATKFMSLFLDVNVVLAQYEEKSVAAYRKLDEFLDCLSRILRPLCEPVYLFPLCTTMQGIIENMSDIFQALNYPWSKSCWENLLKIYTLTANYKPKKASEWDDNGKAASKVDEEDVKQTIIEILSKLMQKNLQRLEESLKSIDEKLLKDFANLANKVQDEESFNELRTVQNFVKDFLKNK